MTNFLSYGLVNASKLTIPCKKKKIKEIKEIKDKIAFILEIPIPLTLTIYLMIN